MTTNTAVASRVAEGSTNPCIVDCTASLPAQVYVKHSAAKLLAFCLRCAGALSQVTSVAGGRQRSVALERVRTESPFALPPLQFCSAAHLRALGHIPRYTTKPQGEGEQWQPTLASQLPENAVTVFLSHR